MTSAEAAHSYLCWFGWLVGDLPFSVACDKVILPLSWVVSLVTPGRLYSWSCRCLQSGFLPRQRNCRNNAASLLVCSYTLLTFPFTSLWFKFNTYFFLCLRLLSTSYVSKYTFFNPHIWILNLDESVPPVCFGQPHRADRNGIQEYLAPWELGQAPSGQMDFRHPHLALLIMESLSAGILGCQERRERLLVCFMYRRVPGLCQGTEVPTFFPSFLKHASLQILFESMVKTGLLTLVPKYCSLHLETWNICSCWLQIITDNGSLCFLFVFLSV